jgi:hypothetical protein
VEVTSADPDNPYLRHASCESIFQSGTFSVVSNSDALFPFSCAVSAKSAATGRGTMTDDAELLNPFSLRLLKDFDLTRCCARDEPRCELERERPWNAAGGVRG